MNWQKGKPFSEEHKRKLAAAFRGRVISDDQKRKLSTANTGKRHTPEAKNKMSLAKKGMPLTPDHIAKIAKAACGKKHTPDTILKMSKAQTPERRAAASSIAKKNNAARVWTEEQRYKLRLHAAKRVFPKSGTKLELRVRSALGRLGFDFETQFTDCGLKGVYDFAIPESGILIEADGCFWHGCQDCGYSGYKNNPSNDAAKNDSAVSNGYTLVRIKECQDAYTQLRAAFDFLPN